ncbi:unnamed protein product, partial [Symbiodinium microadriaticum]
DPASPCKTEWHGFYSGCIVFLEHWAPHPTASDGALSAFHTFSDLPSQHGGFNKIIKRRSKSSHG